MAADIYAHIDEARKSAAPEVSNLSRILYDAFKAHPELAVYYELNQLVDGVNQLDIAEAQQKKLRRKVRNADEEVNMALISNGFYVKGDTPTLAEIQAGLFTAAYNESVDQLVQEGVLYFPDEGADQAVSAEGEEESVAADMQEVSEEASVEQIDEPVEDTDVAVEDTTMALPVEEVAEVEKVTEANELVAPVEPVEDVNVAGEPAVVDHVVSAADIIDPEPQEYVTDALEKMATENEQAEWVSDEPVEAEVKADVAAVADDVEDELEAMLEAQMSQAVEQTLHAHIDTQVSTRESKEIHGVHSTAYSREDDVEVMPEEDEFYEQEESEPAVDDVAEVEPAQETMPEPKTVSADDIIYEEAPVYSSYSEVESDNRVVEEEVVLPQDVAPEVAEVLSEMRHKADDVVPEQAGETLLDEILEDEAEDEDVKPSKPEPMTDYEAALMEVEEDEEAGEPDAVYEAFEREDEEELEALAHHVEPPKKSRFQFKRTQKAKTLQKLKEREAQAEHLPDDGALEEDDIAEKRRYGFGRKKAKAAKTLSEVAMPEEDLIEEYSEEDGEDDTPISTLDDELLEEVTEEAVEKNQKTAKKGGFGFKRKQKSDDDAVDVEIDDHAVADDEAAEQKVVKKKGFGLKRKKTASSDEDLVAQESEKSDELVNDVASVGEDGIDEEGDVDQTPQKKGRFGFASKAKKPAKAAKKGKKSDADAEGMSRAEKRKLNKYYKKAASTDWQAKAAEEAALKADEGEDKSTDKAAQKADAVEEELDMSPEAMAAAMDSHEDAHTFMMAIVPPPPPEPPRDVWDQRDTEYNDAPRRALKALNSITQGEQWFKPCREGMGKDYYTLFGVDFKNAAAVIPAINKKVEEISGISNAFMMRGLVRSGAVVVGRNSKILMVHKHIMEIHEVIEAVEHMGDVMAQYQQRSPVQHRNTPAVVDDEESAA